MSILKKEKTGSDATNRYGLAKLPPGQFHTEKFPVLTYGPEPDISTDEWRLRVFGLVSEERVFTWNEFLALPQTTHHCDLHCVTRWSRFDDDWTGVMFRDLWAAIEPIARPETTFIMQHAYGGYTVNNALEVMLNEDVLFAHTFNGRPLERQHGGPLRVITPKRYAWKGAKWVSGIELMAKDRPGFWEQNGYNNWADPWKEERYW